MSFLSDIELRFPVVHEDSNTQHVIERMSRSTLPGRGSGLVFVLSKSNKLVGVISDSDLRRYVAKHSDLPARVVELMRPDVISLEQSEWTTHSLTALVRQIDKRGWDSFLPIRFLPITDNDILIDVIDLENYREEISELRDKNIVLGLGYIGLTLALVLASSNRRVVGIDTNAEIVRDLELAKTSIQEPGIENLLANHVGRSISFQTSLNGISRPMGISHNYFICVGTPKESEGDLINLSSVWSAVREIGKVMKAGDSVIMRSTVPVGTARKICKLLKQEFGLTVGQDFHYISAPERTVEGNAILELKTLPQLMAGHTRSCLSKGEQIFRNIARTTVPLSSVETCELAKIVTNSFRDYTFAFANYLASICRNLQIDVNELIDGVNFGYERARIPSPSPGVGGPCLSKDPYLLNYIPRHYSLSNSPVVAARALNESAPAEIVDFILKTIPSFQEKNVLFIGLAFKGIPEVRDLRNSTPLEIARNLSNQCKKSFAIDAAADLTELDFSQPLALPHLPDSSISVFMLLNNHEKNAKILDFYMSNVEEMNVWIFDPWNLVNINTVGSKKNRTINLITLSTVKRLSGEKVSRD